MALIIYFLYFLFNSIYISIHSTLKTIKTGKTQKKAKSYHMGDATGRGNENFGQKVVLMFLIDKKYFLLLIFISI